MKMKLLSLLKRNDKASRINTVREVLFENGFESECSNISDSILDMDCQGCVNVRVTPTCKEDLFDGFELSNDDGSLVMCINLETDSEFVPFAIMVFDENRYISVETGFDENGDVAYVAEDGVVLD